MNGRSKPPLAEIERALLFVLGRRAPSESVPARIVADETNAHFEATIAFRSPALRRADVEGFLRARPPWFVEGELGWRLRDAGRAFFERLNAAGLTHDVVALRSQPQQIELHRWQREALATWHERGRRGIVTAATGAGKTELGIAAIVEHVTSTAKRAVVIVPTVDLLHQWVARLRERLSVPVGTAGDGTLDSFERYLVIVCVARTAAEVLPAAVRRISASAEVLLVADECHRYGAATYAMALDAPYSATLGLSATPERNHDDGIERYVVPALGPVIYEYVQDEAIADQVIADFRMLFVGLEFAEVEQTRYDAVAADLARVWRALSTRFPALEEAQNQVEAVKFLVDGEADGDARLWLSLRAEGRRLLSNSGARHAFVAWCARRGLFAGNRTIVFHESIADCESIVATMQAEGMRAAAHHSQLKSTERADVLQRFREGTVSVLVAPRTLDEGIDVPDASLALIAAGTRVKRQTIQRIGRVLRRAPGKDTAKVVKLYVRGAADDPTAASADEYARTLAARGGSVCFAWPAEAAAIEEFLTL